MEVPLWGVQNISNIRANQDAQKFGIIFVLYLFIVILYTQTYLTIDSVVKQN